MSGRVAERALPLAVRLVARWTFPVGAVLDRPCPDGVDVVDVEVEADRCATQRAGTDDAVLRVLVGEHQPGTTDRDLGVADPAVVADVAHHLDRVEHGDVPVDRSCRVADTQVGNERGGCGGGRSCGRRDVGRAHGVGPVWELDDGDVGVDGAERLGDAGAEPCRERRVGGDRLAGFGVAQLLERVHDRTSS